ncbi:MAG: phosphoethanolamine transferase [Alphaproteobacteria bacterium]|nr:phosphoethanolamine transferase [Alphaproteobacteria bacterium]
MHSFLPAFLYICFIGFLPLIYVTIKTVSLEKLKSKTFVKLLVKDFIRTVPVCALVSLPFLIKPEITKIYLIIIQAIFMPLMFLELGHIYLFGVRIGLNTFYSFFVTNMRETKEFISQNIPPVLYVGGILFYGFPFYLITLISTPYYSSLFIQVLVVVCAALLAIPFIHNLPKRWPKFKDGYVLNPFSNLFYHYFAYRRNYLALREKIAQNKAPTFDKITANLKQPQTYIIVIGESSNSMHYSCYGYTRNTNEFTDALKDEIISFSKVTSQFAQTIPSLEQAITFADSEHPNYVYTKGSLIDYFKQAGFKTYWLSNQYALDELETVITALTMHADYNKCFNFGGMKRFEKAGLDGDMLPDIQKILDNEEEKKVIFVHLIGSHSAYVNRYPSEFRYFKGTVPSKKLSTKNQELLNSYDDSVRYTDWVLTEMIKKLKTKNGISYLLYFSDHGEDVFDSTTTKLLGHSELANEPMTSVPLRLWLSKELEEVRPDIKERKKNSNKPYKLEDLIHTVIDISSLSNKDYKPKKSILNSD